ncbi:MAG: hypothetical protein P9M14_08810 [Candidatus Alcyoniella australis]|nr:hypothetical protein [Candidatus Alcyoniella australis]
MTAGEWAMLTSGLAEIKHLLEEFFRDESVPRPLTFVIEKAKE